MSNLHSPGSSSMRASLGATASLLGLALGMTACAGPTPGISSGPSDEDLCGSHVDFGDATYQATSMGGDRHGLPKNPVKGRRLGKADTLCADGPSFVDAYAIKGVPPEEAIYVESYGGAMVAVEFF